jgi:hypothetical protein
VNAAVSWLRALVATWRGRFIAAFLAIQIALPVHYYAARRDRYDERFAWRMFSPIRGMQCDPRFTVDGKQVDLYREFHEAWIEMARRARRVVIETMAARLCGKRPGTSVRLSLECVHYNKRRETIDAPFDLCRVPTL